MTISLFIFCFIFTLWIASAIYIISFPFCRMYFGRLKWRVVYPCGGRSILMSYSMAKNYAEIFDGKVVKDDNT